MCLGNEKFSFDWPIGNLVGRIFKELKGVGGSYCYAQGVDASLTFESSAPLFKGAPRSGEG